MLLLCGAAAFITPIPFLPLTPGSTAFFVTHSFLWGLSSLLVFFHRKRAWHAAGFPTGPPWIPDSQWTHIVPAWGFESSLLTHAINLPLAILMFCKICSSADTLHNALTQKLADMPEDERYGSPMALEHGIFAMHFGFMARDFIAHWNTPDVMFLIHHIGALFLSWCACFIPTIPGIRLLALCATVLEIGSMAYCAWALWSHQVRYSYVWVMTMSNLFYFVAIVGIVVSMPQPCWMMYGLCLLGWCFIAGRMGVLIQEVRCVPGKVE